MFKKHKVVMLPTKKASNIQINGKTKELTYTNKLFAPNMIPYHTNQFLYILSDEEIKELI